MLALLKPDEMFRGRTDGVSYTIHNRTEHDVAFPEHLLSHFSDKSPIHALCCAILSGDDSAVPALIDAASEWFRHEPDLAAERERVLAEVKLQPYGYSELCSSGGAKLIPLLAKLRDLGYGDAVDEYLKPANRVSTDMVQITGLTIDTGATFTIAEALQADARSERDPQTLRCPCSFIGVDPNENQAPPNPKCGACEGTGVLEPYP